MGVTGCGMQQKTRSSYAQLPRGFIQAPGTARIDTRRPPTPPATLWSALLYPLSRSSPPLVALVPLLSLKLTSSRAPFTCALPLARRPPDNSSFVHVDRKRTIAAAPILQLLMLAYGAGSACCVCASPARQGAQLVARQARADVTTFGYSDNVDAPIDDCLPTLLTKNF